MTNDELKYLIKCRDLINYCNEAIDICKMANNSFPEERWDGDEVVYITLCGDGELKLPVYVSYYRGLLEDITNDYKRFKYNAEQIINNA